MSRFSLEEEEEIANLKAFWKKYGNFILTVLIIVFGAFAANNGYKWYKAKQSADSVLAFERIEQTVQKKDLDLLSKVLETLLTEHGSTVYAERGALLAGRAFYDGGKPEKAREALEWVVENGDLSEYVSTARLTLAGLLLEQGDATAANKLLDGKAGPGFEGLFLDRQGDIAQKEGNLKAAKDFYERSLVVLQAESPWRSVVQRKLAALPAGK